MLCSSDAVPPRSAKSVLERSFIVVVSLHAVDSYSWNRAAHRLSSTLPMRTQFPPVCWFRCIVGILICYHLVCRSSCAMSTRQLGVQYWYVRAMWRKRMCSRFRWRDSWPSSFWRANRLVPLSAWEIIFKLWSYTLCNWFSALALAVQKSSLP